jgi:prepilin-type N-terminal cleavage/methylation domain-containing protein
MLRRKGKNFFAQQRGFTLMEMLVAITVFTTLIVTATNIFMLASRSERKVFDMESMQASARFTLEAIAREIRTGLIDYAYYTNRQLMMQTPEKVLALIDSEETPIKFYESNENNEDRCLDENSRPCLLVEVGSLAPVPLSPKGTKVRALNFYISPEQDPFVFDVVSYSYLTNTQPSVTVVLSLESAGRRFNEQSSLDLQTTIASRKYKR